MKIINTFKDKKITLLVVFLILFINITAYSQNTNDGGTTNTASTTLVEKEQKRKDSCKLNAKPITSVSKETATNEQEDVEDLEERETRDLFFYLLFLLASIAIIAGVYFRFCKLLGIELHWRVNGAIIGATTLLLGVTFLCYESSGTYDVRLRKGVIYDKGIKVNDYLIHINYKGKIISKAVPKSIYWNVAIGDTVIFQISNGKLGFIHYDIAEIKKGNKKYVLHSKGTSRNLILMDKVSEQDIDHRNYNIIDSIRKHLIEDFEEITKPDRKSYSLVLSFIVEGDSSKLIKDISMHKYPNDKIKRKVVDLIGRSEELRSLGNGIYLLNVHVYGGYIDGFDIKHIKTKEDYEILIAYHLHDKFPTLGNLRGSVFIDVTVSEDGNNEVKVSQSLHPEIDKMALNLAKNIPWHLSDVKSKRKGTKYRLTIMYAKGKLWQVKMWNMD